MPACATSVMAASVRAVASAARPSSSGKGATKLRVGRAQGVALSMRTPRNVRMDVGRGPGGKDPDRAPRKEGMGQDGNAFGQNVNEGEEISVRELTADEADRMDSGNGSAGLSTDGPGTGGQWISSTTRHVHIFAGIINKGDLDQSQLDKLTIDVDPDCEFNWNEGALQQVFDKFDGLVVQHKGAPLNDYTLRLIGSDCEHFIRKLLQKGEITYDLQHRALNYSMGRPRLALEGVAEEMAAEAAAPAAVLEAETTKETA